MDGQGMLFFSKFIKPGGFLRQEAPQKNTFSVNLFSYCTLDLIKAFDYIVT